MALRAWSSCPLSKVEVGTKPLGRSRLCAVRQGIRIAGAACLHAIAAAVCQPTVHPPGDRVSPNAPDRSHERTDKKGSSWWKRQFYCSGLEDKGAPAQLPVGKPLAFARAPAAWPAFDKLKPDFKEPLRSCSTGLVRSLVPCGYAALQNTGAAIRNLSTGKLGCRAQDVSA